MDGIQTFVHALPADVGGAARVEVAWLRGTTRDSTSPLEASSRWKPAAAATARPQFGRVATTPAAMNRGSPRATSLGN